MLPVFALLLAASPAVAWDHQGDAWASLPVTICVDAHDVDPSWIAEATSAIDGWDEAGATVGLDVLALVDDCAAARIVVTLTPGTDDVTSSAHDGGTVEVGGCAHDELTAAAITFGVDDLRLLHEPAD